MRIISNDSETPAQNQQVITACAFIHDCVDDIQKVFVAKRAVSKKFLPGQFELPGGHIDFGENLIAGLRREIREELAMDVTVGDAFFAFDYANPVKGSHSIEIVYFARFSDSIANIDLNPADHSEYRWIKVGEISDITTPEKGANDFEFQALKQGFALLNGQSMKFG